MTAARRTSRIDFTIRHPGATDAADADVVELHARLRSDIDLARVPDAFGNRAVDWLGSSTGARADGWSGYLCDLEVHASQGGPVLVRKSAIVHIGAPRATPSGWVVPIEWRAATLAPLFPVFVGSLAIEAHRIAIDGWYAPPFGAIGHALDRAVLSVAARATARWFIAKLADAVADDRSSTLLGTR